MNMKSTIIHPKDNNTEDKLKMNEIYSNERFTFTKNDIKSSNKLVTTRISQNKYIVDDELDDSPDGSGNHSVESGTRRHSILSTGHTAIINNSNDVVPLDSIEDFDIYAQQKCKPKYEYKSNKWQSLRTKQLSHEEVVQFMIKERQKMDEEQVQLRLENERLKNELQSTQHRQSVSVSITPSAPPILTTARSEAATTVQSSPHTAISYPTSIFRVHSESSSSSTSSSANSSHSSDDFNKDNDQSNGKDNSGSSNHNNISSMSTQNRTEEEIEYEQTHDKNMKNLIKEAERLRIENRVMQERLRKYQNTSNNTRSNSTINLNPNSLHITPTPSFEPPIYPPYHIDNSIHQDLIVLPRLLWKGGELWKIPFNGKGPPERRYITIKKVISPPTSTVNYSLVGYHRSIRPVILSDGDRIGNSIQGYMFYPPTIIWYSGNNPSEFSSPRELPLEPGVSLSTGYATAAFDRMPNVARVLLPDERLCFSIRTNTRTLDLATDTISAAIEWKRAFVTLLAVVNHPITPNTLNHTVIPPIYMIPRPTNVSLPTDYTENYDRDYNRERSPGSSVTNKEFLTRQLLHAAEIGDANTISKIISQGISINTIDSFVSPHSAAASINKPKGDTALLIACRYGHIDVIRTCLEYGAKNDPHPDYGQTALHIAVGAAQLQAVSILLQTARETNADITISNLTDSDGNTPLHIACRIGDIAIVQVLLNHGADVAGVDAMGRTSLQIACSNGHKPCVAILLDHGADDLLEIPDREGNTALHHAILSNQVSIVRLLLETAANALHRNRKGQTPYALAAIRGQPQIGMLLLEYQNIAMENQQTQQQQQQQQHMTIPLLSPENTRVNPMLRYSPETVHHIAMDMRAVNAIANAKSAEKDRQKDRRKEANTHPIYSTTEYSRSAPTMSHYIRSANNNYINNSSDYMKPSNSMLSDSSEESYSINLYSNTNNNSTGNNIIENDSVESRSEYSIDNHSLSRSRSAMATSSNHFASLALGNQGVGNDSIKRLSEKSSPMRQTFPTRSPPSEHPSVMNWPIYDPNDVEDNIENNHIIHSDPSTPNISPKEGSRNGTIPIGSHSNSSTSNSNGNGSYIRGVSTELHTPLKLSRSNSSGSNASSKSDSNSSANSGTKSSSSPNPLISSSNYTIANVSITMTPTIVNNNQDGRNDQVSSKPTTPAAQSSPMYEESNSTSLSHPLDSYINDMNNSDFDTSTESYSTNQRHMTSWTSVRANTSHSFRKHSSNTSNSSDPLSSDIILTIVNEPHENSRRRSSQESSRKSGQESEIEDQGDPSDQGDQDRDGDFIGMNPRNIRTSVSNPIPIKSWDQHTDKNMLRESRSSYTDNRMESDAILSYATNSSYRNTIEPPLEQTTEQTVEHSMEPIEEFTYENCLWHKYVSETEDYYYYYSPTIDHSQWEDPRFYGITQPTSDSSS